MLARTREVVSAGEARAVMESFQRAIDSQDLQGLLDVLAPQVVLVSDGVLAFCVEDAITGLCYVRNPGKPTRLTSETPLIPR